MLIDGAPAVQPGAAFHGVDFLGQESVVAAVSGGSDSVALLILLDRHFRTLAGPPRLIAATVDHGLRPESALEAAEVGRLCRRLGIEHLILRWEGAKPAAGLAAAARLARYRLLAQAAYDIGADVVLTGHTEDDQAETVFMRAGRGNAGTSDGRGTAGMAPATLFCGATWIVRPLLRTRREALRALLRDDGIGWAEDPSNASEAYERVRARRRLAERPGEHAVLIAQAGRAAALRAAVGERAAALVAANACQTCPGLLRLDPALLAADPEDALYALRILLACAGGNPQLPDEARSRALLRRLADGPVRASLSRATVDSRRGGIYLFRESRGLPRLERGNAGDLWDGRFRLSRQLAPSESIAPLPFDGSEPMEPGHAPAGLVKAAGTARPGRWQAGRCLGAADEPPDALVRPVAAPWALFLPSFDMAPARAAASLLNGAEIPEPPFTGHNETDA